jgi:hypothetical protein
VAVAADAAAVVQNAALVIYDGGDYLYDHHSLRPMLDLPATGQAKVALDSARAKAVKDAAKREKAAEQAQQKKQTAAQLARAKYLGLGEWLGQQLKKARGAKKEPTLVTLCRVGEISRVKAHLARASPYELEGSRTWVEKEDCWHRPGKEWTWHGDTPLIAAARVGRAEVVRALLLAGAKVTNKTSCEHEDQHWTSAQAADQNATCATALLTAAQSGNFGGGCPACKHESGCCYHWLCLGSCHSYESYSDTTWHFFPDKGPDDWSDTAAASVAAEIWQSAADAQTTVALRTVRISHRL